MYLAMILNGVITLGMVPASINVLTVQQLGDESVMTQFDHLPDVDGRRWYPFTDASQPLQRYQSYEEAYMATFDPDTKTVTIVYPIRDWTAQEIHDWKASTDRHITHYALRSRFTQDEKVAFEMALLDDPVALIEVRRAAATVRVLDKDLAAASFVDLNSSKVQAGMAHLESIGVLAAGRADEITWGDIEENEVA